MFAISVAFFVLSGICQILNFSLRPNDREPLRKRLEDWYLKVDLGDWGSIPLTTFRFCDAFLTSILGKRLISRRALLLGAIPAFLTLLILGGATASRVLSAQWYHANLDAKLTAVATFSLYILIGCVIDVLLGILSRYIIRRAVSARRAQLMLSCVSLYIVAAIPGLALVSLANRGDSIFTSALIALAIPAALPFLAPFIHQANRFIGFLAVIGPSLTTYTLFFMFALSYALMLTRRFTRRPLTWFLLRAEARADLFGPIASLFAFIGTAFGLLAAVFEHLNAGKN